MATKYIKSGKRNADNTAISLTIFKVLVNRQKNRLQHGC